MTEEKKQEELSPEELDEVSGGVQMQQINATHNVGRGAARAALKSPAATGRLVKADIAERQVVSQMKTPGVAVDPGVSKQVEKGFNPNKR